ncbi:MAG: isocitrate/isopropylmalate dehydrogenase family protein [Thermoplasmata archaeon]|nr:isocitrate/isopropylmalate dehydrogenase family protein [Thermoplasmata archaeon]
MKSVCVLRGDGIGPEVVDCATRVLTAATDNIEFIYADIGRDAHSRTGNYLPDDTIEAMKGADSCLFGAVTSQRDPGYDSPVLRFRKHLDLYANIRPLKNVSRSSETSLDIIIVRENTEGLYTMNETEDDQGVTTMRRVSRKASKRIISHAIGLARDRRRSGLCCVHKANVLQRSDGLFLKLFTEAVEKEGDWLCHSDRLVDSAAAGIIMFPEEFDVIVTLNLYGDILSDVAAAVVGGLGFAPSGNIGPSHSVFEPAHGSAPDIAGRGVANPTAAILSAGMMLDHLGMTNEAAIVEDAVSAAYRSGARTVDIGGDCGSHKFTERVIDCLRIGD